MNIVYLTTEAVPFAKTGGLADVCGVLPAKVAALGHRCAVIMPAFRSIHRAGLAIEQTDISFALPMGPGRLVGGRVLRGQLPDSEVPVWFIDQPQYFDRDSLYGTSEGDYGDNAERFAFFCRAALTVITRMQWPVDVVHCNDWQTGLVPALIDANRDTIPWADRVKSVMTVHNLAYQGCFDKEQYRWLNLDWSHFRPESFEYYDQINFLKTGIITADAVTTVSPTYAHEIRTPLHGCGLDPVLRGIGDHVSGIINGIDDDVWNPAADTHLPARYDAGNWRDGKAANKRSLQQQLGLRVDADVPLIGLVGRLAHQKGWDLIINVLRRHLREGRPTQWAVLGSGDLSLEDELKRLHAEHPGQFGLHVGFSDQLAHRIEAAADLFVMPSRYEPCGLNQLYSLRYGTVPVVTATGGLADTVINATDETIARGTATGFHMQRFDADSLDDAIGRALRIRYHDPETWKKIVTTGMAIDWSWRKSAVQYAKLYEDLVSLNQTTPQPAIQEV